MKFFTILVCLFFISLSAFAKKKAKVPKHYLTKMIRLGGSSNNVEVFVHYPRHRTEFARKTLKVLRDDIPKIHKYFEYVPQSEIHIVITKEEETANGAAGVFPRNTIFLHDFPPIGFESLSAAVDWSRILIIHEYVHILTLEMTTGVYDFLRNIFGSFMKWAQFTPRWFAEGMAVWAETKFTGEGRLKHPWIRSYIKKILFDDEACHDPLCWDRPWHYPSGQLPYWVGGLLFEHMEKKKPGLVACIAKDYSGNLPLRMNSSFKNCYGKSIAHAYREFRERLMSNKNVPTQWCAFSNDYLCERIFRKYKNVNWFKGYIDNDELSAFIIVPTYQGNFNSKTEGEKLVVYEKETGRFTKYYLDLPIDKIYQLDKGEGEYSFYVSLFYGKGSEIDGSLGREYRFYNWNKKKIRSLGKRGKMPRCHYLVDHKGRKPKCLTYDDSRWGISEYRYKNKKFNKRKIHSFEALKNIRPIALKEGKLKVKVDSSARKKGIEKTVKIEGLKTTNELKSPRLSNEEGYSGLQYLSPNYLMLFLFTGGNLTSLGTVTSLNDPLDRHAVNLGLYYNFGLESDDSPYSGNASYFYSKGDWITGGGYSKFISQSESAGDLVNVFENKFLQTTHRELIESMNIAWDRSLYLSESSETDLFGFKRKLKNLRFINEFSNQANSKSSFYERFTLSLTPMLYENLNNDPYYGFEGNINLNFRTSEKTRLSLDSAYGVLDVDSFSDGIIYGGGSSSAFTGFFFYPSYLIPFTNISGNEMTQARMTFTWNISNPYITSDSIALYLKRIYVIGGTEFIKSDLLINPDAFDSNDVIKRDPEITSYFFGLRTNFDFLYILPLSIDWVFSRSSNKYYDGSFQITFGSFLTF